MFFGFLPFALFAVFARFVPPAAALLVAASAAALLALCKSLLKKRLKWLEAGTLALFGALGLYAELARADWSVLAVRLYVDFGLFLIVVVSIAIGRPFTLQYAREVAPPEVHFKPDFLCVNRRLSSVWAAALGVAAGADFAMLHGLPPVAGGALSVCVLALAAVYTIKTVRERRRLHAARKQV